MIPGPSDEEVDAWLEEKLSPGPGLTLEKLREGPVITPGHQEVAYSDLVFPTPSGKIELWSEEASLRWKVHPLPQSFNPVEFPGARDPGARGYPLNFLTPNTKDRIHSQFNNLEMILTHSTPPVLHMSPGDALERSIRDGDRVRVYNDRGSLELEARLDFGLREGCVSVTNEWWISEGGTVNFLSAGRETDMGHGAAFHDNLVEIERLA